MNQGGNFNIMNNSVPTNQDIVVAFVPTENVQNYTYHVFKNGVDVKQIQVNGHEGAEIYLIETGSYQIHVDTYDINGTLVGVDSGTYLIDKEQPVINVNNDNFTINKGEKFALNDISVTDNYDGDLTANVTNNLSQINLNEPGNYVVTYTVSDRAGNVASRDITVNVVNNNFMLFYGIIIVLFTFVAFLAFRFQRGLKLEKRIERFTIKPIKDNNLSIADKFVYKYKKVTENIAGSLDKSVIASRYAERLDKYAIVSYLHSSGMAIFVGKLFVALLFLLIALVAKIFQLQLLSYYEMVLPFLIGFFFLDILYFIKYKIYRNRLENDLLSAIIIMNNAFRSGRSITQAIDIVSQELSGTIGREFGKMGLELTYGLGIDLVFKRFAERIKIEEVNYLTASLTILNKTGGNIIEVFSSIEKSLFNKKKLKLELKSLTGASKIIVWVLFVVPFLFILAISFISPGYFEPFINTSLGRILTGIMILYYILFIVCVRKIMKVVI